MSILWVDSRNGSIELLPELVKHGLDARSAKLDSGDFAFSGWGPDGDAEFGIERKTLTDFVDSARTGRLYGVSTEQHESQLDRMLKAFDFAWLVLEGQYTTNPLGRLVQVQARRSRVIQGGFSEDGLNKTILSLDLRGGLRVKETNSAKQTVRWLASLFRAHTDKTWDQHTTFRTVQRRESIKPVSQFRDMVMRMEDVGFAASKAVETHVLACLPNGHSLQAMLLTMLSMTLHDWEELNVPSAGGVTRKFGTSRAIRVTESLRRQR